MKETDIQDDLASIRSLMERSSKFISLSGLSGILAGVYALIGGATAYILLKDKNIDYAERDAYAVVSSSVVLSLITVAAIVLTASILTGIFLSYRKAQKK